MSLGSIQAVFVGISVSLLMAATFILNGGKTEQPMVTTQGAFANFADTQSPGFWNTVNFDTQKVDNIAQTYFERVDKNELCTNSKQVVNESFEIFKETFMQLAPKFHKRAFAILKYWMTPESQRITNYPKILLGIDTNDLQRFEKIKKTVMNQKLLEFDQELLTLIKYADVFDILNPNERQQPTQVRNENFEIQANGVIDILKLQLVSPLEPEKDFTMYKNAKTKFETLLKNVPTLELARCGLETTVKWANQLIQMIEMLLSPQPPQMPDNRNQVNPSIPPVIPTVSAPVAQQNGNEERLEQQLSTDGTLEQEFHTSIKNQTSHQRADSVPDPNALVPDSNLLHAPGPRVPTDNERSQGNGRASTTRLRRAALRNEDNNAQVPRGKRGRSSNKSSESGPIHRQKVQAHSTPIHYDFPDPNNPANLKPQSDPVGERYMMSEGVQENAIRQNHSAPANYDYLRSNARLNNTNMKVQSVAGPPEGNSRLEQQPSIDGTHELPDAIINEGEGQPEIQPSPEGDYRLEQHSSTDKTFHSTAETFHSTAETLHDKEPSDGVVEPKAIDESLPLKNLITQKLQMQENENMTPEEYIQKATAEIFAKIVSEENMNKKMFKNYYETLQDETKNFIDKLRAILDIINTASSIQVSLLIRPDFKEDVYNKVKTYYEKDIVGLTYPHDNQDAIIYGPFKRVYLNDGFSDLDFSYLNEEQPLNYVYLGYGESGSGKTHMLLKDKNSVLNKLLESIADKNVTFQVKELYGNVYNPIDECPNKGRDTTFEKVIFYNQEGGETQEPENIDLNQINTVLENVTQTRKNAMRIRMTPNNLESSRSHLFITFQIGIHTVQIIDMGGSEDVDTIQKMYYHMEEIIPVNVVAEHTEALSAILRSEASHVDKAVEWKFKMTDDGDDGKQGYLFKGLNNPYKNIFENTLKKFHKYDDIKNYYNNDDNKPRFQVFSNIPGDFPLTQIPSEFRDFLAGKTRTPVIKYDEWEKLVATRDKIKNEFEKFVTQASFECANLISKMIEIVRGIAEKQNLQREIKLVFAEYLNAVRNTYSGLFQLSLNTQQPIYKVYGLNEAVKERLWALTNGDPDTILNSEKSEILLTSNADITSLGDIILDSNTLIADYYCPLRHEAKYINRTIDFMKCAIESKVNGNPIHEQNDEYIKEFSKAILDYNTLKVYVCLRPDFEVETDVNKKSHLQLGFEKTLAFGHCINPFRYTDSPIDCKCDEIQGSSAPVRAHPLYLEKAETSSAPVRAHALNLADSKTSSARVRAHPLDLADSKTSSLPLSAHAIDSINSTTSGPFYSARSGGGQMVGGSPGSMSWVDLLIHDDDLPVYYAKMGRLVYYKYLFMVQGAVTKRQLIYDAMVTLVTLLTLVSLQPTVSRHAIYLTYDALVSQGILWSMMGSRSEIPAREEINATLAVIFPSHIVLRLLYAIGKK